MPRTVAERADTLPALAEVFREHGYEGASLTLISKATGLGKGSLYHFFPGGKEEMASAVLAEIDGWFETQLFAPLAAADDAAAAIAAMFGLVSDYFRSGRRACLVGMLALSDCRDRFASAISGYFARWVEALATALTRTALSRVHAKVLAQETVAGIQGAITLSRALDNPDLFERMLGQLKARLIVESPAQPPAPAGAERI